MAAVCTGRGLGQPQPASTTRFTLGWDAIFIPAFAGMTKVMRRSPFGGTLHIAVLVDCSLNASGCVLSRAVGFGSVEVACGAVEQALGGVNVRFVQGVVGFIGKLIKLLVKLLALILRLLLALVRAIGRFFDV